MKDALANYFKAIGLTDKLAETKVLSKWEELMGEAVAARTKKKYIKDDILFLELNSSVMRDELQQEKDAIIKKINECAGFELIKDLFLK